MNAAPTMPPDNAVAQAMTLCARLVPDMLLTRRELLVFAALTEVFPAAPLGRLASAIGILGSREFERVRIAAAKKTKWWRDDVVEQLVGELASEFYGEQAR